MVREERREARDRTPELQVELHALDAALVRLDEFHPFEWRWTAARAWLRVEVG